MQAASFKCGCAFARIRTLEKAVEGHRSPRRWRARAGVVWGAGSRSGNREYANYANGTRGLFWMENLRTRRRGGGRRLTMSYLMSCLGRGGCRAGRQGVL